MRACFLPARHRFPAQGQEHGAHARNAARSLRTGDSLLLDSRDSEGALSVRRTSGAEAQEIHEKLKSRPAVVGLAIGAAALLAITVADARSWFLVPLVLTVTWSVWVVLVWPRVVTREDEVVIRNTLATLIVPYSDIDTVSAGLALKVRTRSGQQATAAGVYGRAGMGWEAMRTAQAHANSVVPVRRVDELRLTAVRTQASQVAQIILRRAALAEGPPSRAQRSWNWGVIAVSAVLLMSTVAALVMRAA